MRTIGFVVSMVGVLVQAIRLFYDAAPRTTKVWLLRHAARFMSAVARELASLELSAEARGARLNDAADRIEADL